MKYVIDGANKLCGEVKIQAAKNSVVSLISASIMAGGDVFIKNCPRIDDVICMTKILKKMGARVNFLDDGLHIDASSLNTCAIPEKLSCKVRASLFMVGALLGRYKCASICQTGGCDIGSRPLDIHVDAFKKLGARVTENDGLLSFEAEKLKGTDIRLRYPSVGATENVMMAATLAEGVTVIENCACEPEICDLQNFLNLLGAKISGAGTPFIRIDGVKKLGSGCFSPISDRIETGTFMLAVAATGGELEIKGAKSQNISILTEKLLNNACKIYVGNDIIYMRVYNKLRGFGEIVTKPYPGFPTDLQPLLVACACSCEGRTIVKETVFESRFRYAAELKKMGANLSVCGDTVEVIGSPLFGARVTAPDLRGGASLCIAALTADGETIIDNIRSIERGYENLDDKFARLGAKFYRK